MFLRLHTLKHSQSIRLLNCKQQGSSAGWRPNCGAWESSMRHAHSAAICGLLAGSQHHHSHSQESSRALTAASSASSR